MLPMYLIKNNQLYSKSKYLKILISHFLTSLDHEYDLLITSEKQIKQHCNWLSASLKLFVMNYLLPNLKQQHSHIQFMNNT